MDKHILLGASVAMKGMVAELNASGAKPPRVVERSLGYHAGRLADGYFMLLLKQQVRSEDITFEGTTLRSGGRTGLPLADSIADGNRQRVKNLIDPSTREARRAQLSGERTPIRGASRWCKVRPFIQHTDLMSPADQYPMGGGFGQWTLTQPYQFLIAAIVDRDQVAHTPSFSVSIAEDAPYDGRARLRAFLEAA